MHWKDNPEVRVKHGPTDRRVGEMASVRLLVSLIALTAVFGMMLVMLQNSAAASQQATQTSVTGPTDMAPTVTTGEQSVFFPQDDATLNGAVEGSPGQATADFEYGLSTEYGLASETQEITIPTDGPLSVSTPLTGLSLETTYHYRLVIAQDGVTYYGNDRQFTTHGPVPIAGVSGEPSKTPESTNTESQPNSPLVSTAAPRVALLGAVWRRGQLVVTIRCLGTTSQRCHGSGILTEKKRPGGHPLAVARIQASVTGGHTAHIVAKRLTSRTKLHSMDAHTLILTFNMKQSTAVASPAH
jgi:hypothetical protein